MKRDDKLFSGAICNFEAPGGKNSGKNLHNCLQFKSAIGKQSNKKIIYYASLHLMLHYLEYSWLNCIQGHHLITCKFDLCGALVSGDEGLIIEENAPNK